MLVRRAIAPCAHTAILFAAAAVRAQGVPLPTYHVETRWVPMGPLINGMTALTLTLQGRAIYDTPFPADFPEGSLGNYNIFSLGYGPNGASQPSTITRTGQTQGTSLIRGQWGPYNIDPGDGEPPYEWTVRGAAPGVQSAPNSPVFRRGFRFFNNTSAALDNATGNGTGGDLANGTFDINGNLTGFNLLRDDFQSPVRQQRNLTDPDGGPAWQDLYRVGMYDPRGMSFVPWGGPSVVITFDGWLRSAGVSYPIGNNWTLTGGASVHSSTTFNLYFIPSPGTSTWLCAFVVMVARRRRSV